MLKKKYLFLLFMLALFCADTAVAKDSSTDESAVNIKPADSAKSQKSIELDRKRSELRSSLKKDSADYKQRKALAREKKRDQIAAQEFYDSYKKYDDLIHPEEEKEPEKTDLIFLDDRAERFRKWVDENMRLNRDRDKNKENVEQKSETEESSTEEKVKDLDDLFAD